MTVLITGAAGGIGSELAGVLAERGQRLVLVDIDGDKVKETADRIERLGAKCDAYPADVSSLEDVSRLRKTVDAEVGDVDVLINNAGIAIMADFLETPVDEMRRIFDVNLWGCINMLRAFLPGMLSRGSGHIVNVASAAGLAAMPTFSTYSTSKFAIVGLSEALHHELGDKGIRVTLACPSVVLTPILGSTPRYGYDAGYVSMVERLGIEPRKAAEIILKGMEKGKFLVIPGNVGKLGYNTKRASLKISLISGRQLYRLNQRFRSR